MSVSFIESKLILPFDPLFDLKLFSAIFLSLFGLFVVFSENKTNIKI